MNPKTSKSYSLLVWPLSTLPFVVLFSVQLLGSKGLAESDEAPASQAVRASPAGHSTAAGNVKAQPTAASEQDLCKSTINSTVRPQNRTRLSEFCKRVERLPSCSSTEGRPIQHVNFTSRDAKAKRILVFGLIHGDEPLAGEMTLEWSERLQTLREKNLEPRNTWRVIPMLNPDGLIRHTRMNANGVDLNRNFPTKDWKEEATGFWKGQAKSDPRRFPGLNPASEAETRCAIAQIKDFKPDFIVSVHTPYRVLDFDGPMMPFPNYKDLPWQALGNFPGSLGRFMWRDYKVPVLTVELGQNMVDVAQLQDILGTFAIEASRRSGQKTAGLFDML